MDLNIKGRRAFVSGSSSGIGQAIALRLAGEGCDVAVHGRDAARTHDVAQRCMAFGVSTVAVVGDLASEADCNRVVTETLIALGGVEIVVNNCGGSLIKENVPWSETPLETWLDSFQLNFMSAVRISKLFLPSVKASGWGRFVNMSSLSAGIPGTMPHYSAAKAALHKLTSDMAHDVGRFGATANGVAPGLVRTPAAETWLRSIAKQQGWEGDTDEFARRWNTEILPQPVSTMVMPDDIAALVSFLASPLAAHITGSTIRVDGGAAKSVNL